MNFRKKFIKDAITLLEKETDLFTDWEKEFFDDIKKAVEEGYELSSRQYNTLMELYNNYR